MRVRAHSGGSTRRTLTLTFLVATAITFATAAGAQEDDGGCGDQCGGEDDGAWAELIRSGSTGDPDPRPASSGMTTSQRWYSYCFPFSHTVSPWKRVNHKQFGEPDSEADPPPKPGTDHWWEEGEEWTLEQIREHGLNPTGRYHRVGARCKHVEGYFRDDPSDDEWGDPFYDVGYGEYFVVAFLEPISLDELLDQARDAVVPPEPAPAFSPEPDGLLTQLETWLWVDTPWEPISESVEVGFVTMTVTATPLRTIWEMGDGSETVSCDGPGEEWQPAFGPEMTAPCGHTYTDSSDVAEGGRFDGSVGVEWELTWQLEVGDEVEDGGLVDPDEPTIVTESEFSVDVDEIQVIVE